MNQSLPADVVRARMQQVRRNLDQELDTMVVNAHTMIDNARSMVDWKHYVATYPWVCAAGAAALGYILVPKPAQGMRPHPATLAKQDANNRLSTGAEPTPSEKTVWKDSLLAALAGIVVRTAIQYLTQQAGMLLGLGEAPTRTAAVSDRR